MLVHKLTSICWKQIVQMFVFFFTHQKPDPDLGYISRAEEMFLVCCLADCLLKWERCHRGARRYRFCSDDAHITLERCTWVHPRSLFWLPIPWMKKVCVIVSDSYSRDTHTHTHTVGESARGVWCRRQTRSTDKPKTPQNHYVPCSDQQDNTYLSPVSHFVFCFVLCCLVKPQVHL